MSQNEIYATFSNHLEELRLSVLKALLALILGVMTAFLFYEKIFYFLTAPLGQATAGNIKENLAILSPIDGILSTIKVCFWTGFLGSSPIWLFFLFQFISPALKKEEKKLVFPVFACSALFLLSGFLFAYYMMIPFANDYLYSFNGSIGKNLWTLSNYMDYTLFLLAGNAAVFELGALLFLLVHFRFLSYETLRQKRRLVILGAFIIGALLTPPDVMTQLMLALPLIGLYELAIWYARAICARESSHCCRADLGSDAIHQQSR